MNPLHYNQQWHDDIGIHCFLWGTNGNVCWKQYSFVFKPHTTGNQMTLTNDHDMELYMIWIISDQVIVYVFVAVVDQDVEY